ncbi:MAG: lysylphosphatidylglycerol synthase domain-containing protein, partial [Planctomycetota bacterium]
GALYLLALLPAAFFWRHLLRLLGQDARTGEVLHAYFVGHLGKYFPGKAMVVVIRTALIRSHRVDTGVAAVSVFMETLTLMSIGAFMAAAILAVGFHQQIPLLLLALGVMLAAGVPTLPPVFRRLVKLARVGRSDPDIIRKLDQLRFGSLFRGWVLMAAGWVCMGLSLWAVLRAMGVGEVMPFHALPRYVASVSLAMVAGFLSLVPGGALVREAILTSLMVPYLTIAAPDKSAEAVALVSAIVLRLVWIAAEITLSGLLSLGKLHLFSALKGRNLFLLFLMLSCLSVFMTLPW